MKKNYWKHIFEKEQNDKNVEVESKNIANKIDQAINQCLKDKQKNQEEIEQIKKWITDAILKIYNVPQNFWYNEIEHFEEIIQKPENKNISKKIAAKCAEIVYGYKAQIEIRITKINFCDSLLEQYNILKQKFNEANNRIKQQAIEDKQFTELEIHADRLKQMQENNNAIEITRLTSDKLNNLESDLTVLEEQIKLNEEFTKILEKLDTAGTKEQTEKISETFAQTIESYLKEFKNKD